MIVLNSYRLTLAALLLSAGSVFAQPGTAKDPAVSAPNDAVSKDWLPSKRPDGAYDRVRQDQRRTMPIPWQPIREADILWKKRVWREIDTREKQNVAFRYAGDEQSGGGMFIEILIDAIKKGVDGITAFSTVDDRFTTPMTKDEVQAMTAGKTDTIFVENPVTGEQEMRIRTTDFQPTTITKFRIKEDWIFDRNVGQMVVRIVGLAPVKDIYGDAGDYRASQTMFWLYYPDIRNLLARYEVYNPNNDLARMTWDEFFERRQFASKIYKISNPYGEFSGRYGQEFKELGLNPMEQLYESRKIADDIFNKEHDMWVY